MQNKGSGLTESNLVLDEKRVGSSSKKDFKQKLRVYRDYLEKGWNNRFIVKFSKDNLAYHKTQREYFDINRRFDKHFRDKFEERDAVLRIYNIKHKEKIKNSLGSYRSEAFLKNILITKKPRVMLNLIRGQKKSKS